MQKISKTKALAELKTKSSNLYPLKFQPILLEKIWGGQKLKELLGKDTQGLSNSGESWEISGVPGKVSMVSNGAFAGKDLNQVIDQLGSDLMGRSVISAFGKEFPLLIKFIDAAADLSIQVHPDDALAKQKHNCLGKTEMWYVMQADQGATLITGFNKETNREEFLEYFNNGRVLDIVNEENVEAGDVFFIPAGRIHTIGKGLLIAEIQQTSDVTYRIYDFDRVDKHGNRRELHLEDSLDAMDYGFHNAYKTKYSDSPNKVNSVVANRFFVTNKINITESMVLDRAQLDSFKIYICTKGSGTVEGVELQMGETTLVPAGISSLRIEPDGEFELLETYVDLP